MQGDYYIPCLTLPAEEEKPIGIWEQRHRRYLKEHKKIIYTTLLTSGKLNSHLADIDGQAEEMLFRLNKQMADSEDITEKLKVKNQILWVDKMNAIRDAAREIVNNDLIYA